MTAEDLPILYCEEGYYLIPTKMSAEYNAYKT